MSVDIDKLRVKILRALEVDGMHSIEDVGNALEKGELQQWLYGETVVITHLLNFPQGRACEFFTVAGCLDDAWELEPEIIAWAKDQGCTKVFGRGRKGWSRELKKHGYQQQWLVASKEI